MGNNLEYISIQEKVKDLIQHTSVGLYCPKSIPPKEKYEINHKMEWLFNAPARERVLNYLQEQMNMTCPTATSMDEIGMFSQKSFLNNNDEHSLYDMSNPDDNIEEQWKIFFFEYTDVIHNSSENYFQKEFEEFVNNLII